MNRSARLPLPETPIITAIIPCWNEEKHLARCLDSIVNCDYPKESLAVLVVDGMSRDRSSAIAEGYARQHTFIRCIENPKRTLAAAWNLGIRHGTGEVKVCMNAHASIEPDFFSRCVRHLREHKADCVGPVIITHPSENSFLGRAIACAMSSRFGVGNSYFRTGTTKPRWVDTLHFSAYRADVFEHIGLYNEELTRSQDIELHLRLKKAGGRLLLAPDIIINYYTRSKAYDFLKYGFINGYWVTYPYRLGTAVARARHLVPLAFASSLLITTLLGLVHPPFSPAPLFLITLYSVAALSASMKCAMDRSDPFLIAVIPWIFFTYHITYGLGSLGGLLRALFSMRFWSNLPTILAFYTRSAVAPEKIRLIGDSPPKEKEAVI